MPDTVYNMKLLSMISVVARAKIFKEIAEELGNLGPGSPLDGSGSPSFNKHHRFLYICFLDKTLHRSFFTTFLNYRPTTMDNNQRKVSSVSAKCCRQLVERIICSIPPQSEHGLRCHSVKHEDTQIQEDDKEMNMKILPEDLWRTGFYSIWITLTKYPTLQKGSQRRTANTGPEWSKDKGCKSMDNAKWSGEWYDLIKNGNVFFSFFPKLDAGDKNWTA